MDRCRNLILKAYPKMSREDREKLAVSHFVNGLFNKKIAAHLTAQCKLSANEAVNKSATIATIFKEPVKSRKNPPAADFAIFSKQPSGMLSQPSSEA